MKKINNYLLSLSFISSSLLSLEISLMRVLRVEGFGSFTYSAIALALTGFGASGTLIYLFQKRISGKEKEVSLVSALLFVFTLGMGYYLSKKITFDPLRIVWDKNQFVRLLFRYLIYTIPFIFGSTFVVLAFFLERAGKAYFYNLLGSGFGIFIILVSLYIIPPKRILLIPIILAILSIALLSLSMGFKYRYIPFIGVPVALGLGFFYLGDINILPYKGIKLALNLPDARVIERRISPFGTLEVVFSSKIRIAPGLSFAFDGKLPEQSGLFLDGDRISALDRISDEGSLKYLLYQTQSVAYILYENPSVFIIGLGGGIPLERAYINKAKSITTSEENPHIPHLLKDSFQDYNNNFFNMDNIHIFRDTGRNLLGIQNRMYDIIEYSELDSPSSSIGGIYATDTDYTLTIQAFQEYINHLNDEGLFSATVRLNYPPRNLLKLLSIARASLEGPGINPLQRVVVIRSWSTGTLLLKKTPFTIKEISKIKSFCERNFFDLVYYPGMKKEEANRFNVMEDDLFYENTQLLFNNPDPLMKNYIFNIKPSTDEKPYFSYFIKIRNIPYLFKEMGNRWLFVVEGGYIVLFSTFMVTILLAFLFIVFPLLLLGRRVGIKKIRTILYFGSIALGYMFIEIILMERLRKYISNPIYTNSVILSSLLIFSGIGSYCSDYFTLKKRRTVTLAVTFLIVYSLIFYFLSDSIYLKIAKAPFFLKITVSLLLIPPFGFVMGFPFPLGISQIKNRGAPTLAWAWSINGYLSVVASSGVVLLSSNIGLLYSGICALFFYLLATIFFPE